MDEINERLVKKAKVAFNDGFMFGEKGGRIPENEYCMSAKDHRDGAWNGSQKLFATVIE